MFWLAVGLAVAVAELLVVRTKVARGLALWAMVLFALMLFNRLRRRR